MASGDLTKKVVVDVRGEMLDLKETVNGMTESLSVFADEVTRVAREVGTEGRLGGQANVTNVGGMWKVRPYHSSFFRLTWVFLTAGPDGLCERYGCQCELHATDGFLMGLHRGEQLTLQVRTIAVATVCDSSRAAPPKMTMLVTDGRCSRRFNPKSDGRFCVWRNPAPGEHDQ